MTYVRLGPEYDLVPNIGAAVDIQCILKGVYSGHVDHVILVYRNNNNIAWLILGTWQNDPYVQAWCKDHSLQIDTWSKPGSKEYGGSKAKALLIVERFLDLLTGLADIEVEHYEWHSTTKQLAA